MRVPKKTALPCTLEAPSQSSRMVHLRPQTTSAFHLLSMAQDHAQNVQEAEIFYLILPHCETLCKSGSLCVWVSPKKIF